MKNQLLLALFGFLILTGCANPQKLLDSGEYDQAIRAAAKKIRGKKNIKDKHVMALEEAFDKAQDRDMRRVSFLKMEGRQENWEEIHHIYKRVAARQRVVDPLIPLYSKSGYEARFRLVNVDELKIESREKTAEYLYQRAEELLKESRATGLRGPAREAYDELVKVDDIYRNYKDKDRLMKQAEFLGTEQWLIGMKNNSDVMLPGEFKRRLMKIDVGDLNSRWVQFNLYANDEIILDYEVVISIDEIDVSPNRETERQFDESREIEDGFEYVLDENGNVMKDTAGNDIKVPRTKFIKATVLEIFQSKAAYISGSWDLIDARTGNLIKTEPLTVETGFENYASTLVGGDDRALKKETRKRLGNKPVPFPSDEQLLLEAAEVLKGKIKDRIRSFR